MRPQGVATLPRIVGRSAYPIPDQVGKYAPWSEFVKAPKYMAQWVHWRNRTEQILQGRFDEVLPAHYEGIFTLVCNFMCPHCSRRVTRTKWVEGGTWDHNTEIEKKNTMHPLGLKRVIDELAKARTDDQMGIVWGGGDPTANPHTYDGLAYARAKGITSSFLTNGTFLDVDRCLENDPILIRISLNCGSEEVYRKFHGYPRGWDYFDRVKRNMRHLARRKLETGARTLVGISLIADERNMRDIVAAAEEIRAVVDDAGPGIDYVIARPVMNYAHFDQPWARLKDDTTQRCLDLLWTSDRRQRMLAARNDARCFQTTCPHNSRGHHHNRVFHQIEQFRRVGRMPEVRQWVEDLREVTYPLGHSFFV